MMRALVLAAFAAIAVLLVGIGNNAPDAASDPWHVVHWDSISHPDGFQEVFQVAGVGDTAVATADVEVLVDGEAVAYDIVDTDGQLGIGDQIRFVMAAFDFQRELEVRHAGTPLWSGSFGSGAGTPVAGAH